MGCLMLEVLSQQAMLFFFKSEETQRGAVQPGKGWVRVLSFGLWF